MSLVVETGTGSSSAESYESVSNADAYWAARGAPTAWADKKATGTLTFASNPLDGESMTIGLRAYTFKSTLTASPDQIKIGANLIATIDNIRRTINGLSVAGTHCSTGTSADDKAEVIAVTSTALSFRSRGGGPDYNIPTIDAFSDPDNRFSDATLTGGELTREIALRNATQAIDAMFKTRWLGDRLNATQALDFPRWGLPSLSGCGYREPSPLPLELRQATCELALRNAQGTTLIPDQAPTDRGVKSESKSLGSLSKSVTYVGSKSTQTYFSIAQQMLTSLIGGLSAERA